jgi:hypothetical protein
MSYISSRMVPTSSTVQFYDLNSNFFVEKLGIRYEHGGHGPSLFQSIVSKAFMPSARSTACR